LQAGFKQATQMPAQKFLATDSLVPMTLLDSTYKTIDQNVHLFFNVSNRGGAKKISRGSHVDSYITGQSVQQLGHAVQLKKHEC